jgi:hypothetical protein
MLSIIFKGGYDFDKPLHYYYSFFLQSGYHVPIRGVFFFIGPEAGNEIRYLTQPQGS